RSAPTQQSRPASTAAHQTPVQHAPPPPPATMGAPSQGPGLFANMASTAAGVAVGSTIGHTLGAGITGLFGGGSSAPAPEAAPAQAAPVQQQQSSFGATSCDADSKAFTRCLDENEGNMQICGWYLDQ
ncbi:hypothetical protein SAICODRAFT_50308, partial [Saitoella complicata NRRL Y-17804]|uniref:uncharacterized protein n=1 Tax=Saitoella complicata (strain BCRC 22490 / CBS 7301 / JCM 7358 / NBRC 10748 / NRRL Y-17804) TaxID=698492 RepID=UPI0008670ACB